MKKGLKVKNKDKFMLKWYNNLYVGNTAKKKKQKMIKKINSGSGQLAAYVVTLASNRANNLEVFSANYLLKDVLRNNCPLIVGIAKSYEEAIELVREITQDVYEKTGTADIRGYLEGNMKTEMNG